LFLNGEVTEVVVDDLIPYDYSDSDCWAFARAKNREVYVLILEKAFAKVFGSYEALEQGMPY
jgi:calpain-15